MSGENYSSMLSRINSTETLDGLRALETNLKRCYDNHVLTPREYARLDIKLLDKIIKKS